jgi:uncharacterized Ntn-hydrolase superfamily protein
MKRRFIVGAFAAAILAVSGVVLTMPSNRVPQAGTNIRGPLHPLAEVQTTAPQPATEEAIIATFSIAAVDQESGVCGAAVASRSPAVGMVVAFARADVGAFCTQHYALPKWGERALDLLAEGKHPQAVLAELLRDDENPDQRQLGIVDMKGRTAQHNPVKDAGKAYLGAMSGLHYACQGNGLTGREVIVAMAKAYEETKGSLADRLMAALLAGDCAGGDHRGRLAAGIRVAKSGVKGYWLELHVDKSNDAVIDLEIDCVQAHNNWLTFDACLHNICSWQISTRARSTAS